MSKELELKHLSKIAEVTDLANKLNVASKLASTLKVPQNFQETEALKLIRHMNERHNLFNSLTQKSHLKNLLVPTSANTANMTSFEERTALATKECATQAAAQLDGSSQRAIDIARRIVQNIQKTSEPPTTSRQTIPTSHRQNSEAIAIKSVSDLGQMIRTARKVMKLNQAEFAAHAGVGRRFISELEGGKRSLEFDKVLACAATAGIDIFARKRAT